MRVAPANTRSLRSSARAEPKLRPNRVALVPHRCACGGTARGAGECAACRAKRLARGGALAPLVVHEVLRSPGQPLEPGLRAEMQARLGRDFSQVRVHTDPRAAESARAVAAFAYTVGTDVVFDKGQYSPTSAAGKRLLAHELAHVVQQGGVARPPAGGLRIDSPTSAAERGAEAAARGSAPAARGVQPTPSLQRLGANPSCTPAQVRDIHQAIFNARGWLNKAIPKLEARPLPPQVLQSLRSNFGPTYGVAGNAALIVGRLHTAYHELSTIPVGCAGAADATECAKEHCGFAGAGSHAATICTNVAGNAVDDAACVLHESLHAAFPNFTVDQYSGWHGRANPTPGYPGTGTEPLLNADSYTSLVIDLS